jgi:hypothetical protein
MIHAMLEAISYIDVLARLNAFIKTTHDYVEVMVNIRDLTDHQLYLDVIAFKPLPGYALELTLGDGSRKIVRGQDILNIHMRISHVPFEDVSSNPYKHPAIPPERKKDAN